mmetsp:Transcript_34774/g.25925  ORF Transcript_34774/g.25925 Transcript_34774/m.25925 type:complete len:101 (+) Transcript_34774:221-523(+)
MKDNPFIKTVKTTRKHLLIRKEDTRIEYRVFVITEGIPYCKDFNVEEHWVIISPNDKSKKCILRQSNNILFWKSIMMKNKIIKNSQEQALKNFEVFKGFY